MFNSFTLLSRIKVLSRQHRLLIIFSLSIFFWQIFDGIITYFTPILITQRGFSNSQMGLIIGSSSVFGAFLDFILAKILKTTNYLRTLLIIIAISFFYPLTLWYSNHIFLYLLAMFIWGLYWDLYRFVSFDFVAHNSSPKNNCFEFSVITFFRSIALILAPLIAGLLIFDAVEFTSLIIPSIFLVIAAGFYLVLISLAPIHHTHSISLHRHHHNFSWLSEFRQIILASRHILPIFFLNIILVVFDSTFWTLGPLIGNHITTINDFGGLLMMAYMLPGLFNTIFIDKIVGKFGKFKVSFLGFIISGLFLTPLFIVRQPWLILSLVFVSSVISTSSWPALSGLFTDYIESHPQQQKEYESLNDLSVNIGFVIGPILAGFFADSSDLFRSLGLVSVATMVSAILVYLFSFRRI